MYEGVQVAHAADEDVGFGGRDAVEDGESFVAERVRGEEQGRGADDARLVVLVVYEAVAALGEDGVFVDY